MADKPQNASLHPGHDPKSFSNILTALIILIGIGVAVMAIYVGERQNTEELRKELMNLKSQIELQWEEWGPWSSCVAHCKDGVGDRLQSRTRNKNYAGDLEKSSQTESRPCSSVQFDGCISPQNGDQFFAVAHDYLHMLAQSTCTAMAPNGRVNAVMKTCSSKSSDCNAVCKKVGTECFNALHVYFDKSYVTPLERLAVEQKSLEIYKYGGCGGQFCGPNFCCCKSS